MNVYLVTLECGIWFVTWGNTEAAVREHFPKFSPIIHGISMTPDCGIRACVLKAADIQPTDLDATMLRIHRAHEGR